MQKKSKPLDRKAWTPEEDKILLETGSNILAGLKLTRTPQSCSQRRGKLKIAGKASVPVQRVRAKRAAKTYRLQQKAIEAGNNTTKSSPQPFKVTAQNPTMKVKTNKISLEINGLKINFPNNLKFSIHGDEVNFE